MAIPVVAGAALLQVVGTGAWRAAQLLSKTIHEHQGLARAITSGVGKASRAKATKREQAAAQSLAELTTHEALSTRILGKIQHHLQALEQAKAKQLQSGERVHEADQMVRQEQANMLVECMRATNEAQGAVIRSATQVGSSEVAQLSMKHIEENVERMQAIQEKLVCTMDEEARDTARESLQNDPEQLQTMESLFEKYPIDTPPPPEPEVNHAAIP